MVTILTISPTRQIYLDMNSDFEGSAQRQMMDLPPSSNSLKLHERKDYRLKCGIKKAGRSLTCLG